MGKVNFADFRKTDIPKTPSIQRREKEKTKTKKVPDIPKIKKEKKELKLPDIELKFEPYTSWYRGIAELLKGYSVRGTKLHAIDSIIEELEKRKAQLLNKE